MDRAIFLSYLTVSIASASVSNLVEIVIICLQPKSKFPLINQKTHFNTMPFFEPTNIKEDVSSV